MKDSILKSMAGLIAGKNVEEAGRMGAVAGALATQTTGDIEGYPDKEQMKAAMENAEITFR
jgi:Sugar kinases, ribokinase family